MIVGCCLELKKLSKDKIDLLDLKLAPEGPLQYRGCEGVKLGGGLGLVAFESVELGLQGIKMGDYSVLFLGIW